MRTDFVVVRHGETFANIEGRLQGQSNTHLNELGRQQVQTAADWLKDEKIDACYSSDLWRAMETAEIVLQYHPGVTAVPSPALREWNIGKYEGELQTVIREQEPELLQAFLYENNNVRATGGESRMEFQARVENFMNSIAEKHQGERVLITTHGGTLQRILRMAFGCASPDCLLPLSSNASVSRFARVGEKREWQLIAWNQDGHLRDLPLHATLVY